MAIEGDAYLSQAHERVVRLLQVMGHELMVEVDFPPYRADVYLPDLHLVLEVDGPHHGARHDDRRDTNLWAEYLLPTLRVSHDVALEDLETAVERAKDRWAHTAEDRFESVSMRLPWL